MWNSKPTTSPTSGTNAFSNPTAAGLAARRSPTNGPISPRSRRAPVTTVRTLDDNTVISQISASTSVLQQKRQLALPSSPTDSVVQRALSVADSHLNDKEPKPATPKNYRVPLKSKTSSIPETPIPDNGETIQNQESQPSDASMASASHTSPPPSVQSANNSVKMTPAVRRFEKITNKAVEDFNKAHSPRKRGTDTPTSSASIANSFVNDNINHPPAQVVTGSVAESTGSKAEVKSTMGEYSVITASTASQKSNSSGTPRSGNVVDTNGLLVNNAEPMHSGGSVSSASSSRRPLDLIHNDNAFHVIANIVLERLQRHEKGSDLDTSDWKILDASVPIALRENFIKAVRFRLKYNCPPTSDAHIYVLTRQCGDYNLGKDSDENPLLRRNNSGASSASTVEATKQTIDSMPTLGSIHPVASRSMSGIHQVNSFQNTSESVASFQNPSLYKMPPAPVSPTKKPPLAPASESDAKTLRGQEEQQRRMRSRDVELHENTSVASVLTSPSLEQQQAITTESLARKQLIAELREASTLMAESQTPEAAEFWKNHVISLQARLRSLHNEDGPEDERTVSVPQRTNETLQPMRGSHDTRHVVEEDLMTTPKYGQTHYGSEFFHPPLETIEPSPRAMYPQHHPPRSSPFEPLSYQSPDDEHSPPYDSPSPPPIDPSPNSMIGSPQTESESESNRDDSMVDVMSPADLPAGYHFEAEIDGERFLATVPYGGVKQGETFSCVKKKLAPNGPYVPVGLWRDRLCDCFKFGICHPVNLVTILFPLISLGQVLIRLRLDAFGRPIKAHSSNEAQKSMWTITYFWIATNIMILGGCGLKLSSGLPFSIADFAAFALLNIAGMAYSIFLTSVARSSIRDMFNIQEQRFYDFEDKCCSTFCMVCTICQLHRHTVPYDQFEAFAFTKTGVRDGVSVDFIATSAGMKVGKM